MGRRQAFFAVLASLFLTTIANAATYYVSPSGVDTNAGTSGAPWKTLQKAANTAVAGDTVIVRDGTYTDATAANRVVFLSTSGTSTSPITFKSENRHGAVIDGQNTKEYGIVFGNSTSHIVLDGFELKNIKNGGIWANGNPGNTNVTVRRVSLHDIGRPMVSPCTDGLGRAGLFLGYYTADWTIEDSRIYNNGRIPNPACDSLTRAENHNYRHDHGIYAQGRRHKIRRNTFFAHAAGLHIKVDGHFGTLNSGDYTHYIDGNVFGSNTNPDDRACGTVTIYNNRTVVGGVTMSNPKMLLENNVFVDPKGKNLDPAYNYDTGFCFLPDNESSGYGGHMIRNNLTESKYMFNEDRSWVQSLGSSITSYGNITSGVARLYNPDQEICEQKLPVECRYDCALRGECAPGPESSSVLNMSMNLDDGGVTPTPTPTPTPTATPITVACNPNGPVTTVASTLPIVPGLQGHGVRTVAGSGRHLQQPCTTIYKVTNLNDSGVGSLRSCVEASGPRTCVFETSGRIKLTSALVATSPYLTVAGQTAPSPGIAISGAVFETQASDVLVQHLKMHVGDETGSDPGSRDGFRVASKTSVPVKNIVLDHASIAWALDEGISLSPEQANITDVTIANTIIQAGLNMSIHPEANTPNDMGHSKGMLINGAKDVARLTFAKNLLAHNADRNIRASTGLTMEFLNNVVYNWGRGRGSGRTIELTNSSTRQALHMIDVIGNHYKPGPETWCPDTTIWPNCTEDVASGGTDTAAEKLKLHYILRLGSGTSSGLQPGSRYYLSDNIGPTRGSGDEWLAAASGFYTDNSRSNLVFPANKATSRVASSGATTMSSTAGHSYVLANAGARPKQRDTVDTKTVNDVTNGTGRIIDCVTGCTKNAGGWPTYTVNTRTLTIPTNPHGDTDGDGYTNLEEWLHGYLADVE